MNVFQYFWTLVKLLFDSAGDHEEIKGALILLLLFGFVIGFAVGIAVASLAARARRRG